ncbi:MAG: glycosyltransferase family 2 protein [Enterococcus italicus]|uniref:glycosyltransferase family 2 protein n=1 Tax=Enterococcus italicus TaxID=246144 RepID=UPI00399363C5
MNFSVVVLHYNLTDFTIKCVESLKNLNYKNLNIIIVDNCSSNESGTLLDEKYKSDNNIHVILSKENLGFAKGNNLGYRYALQFLNPDFIVFSNNDVVIKQINFFNRVVDIYQEKKFAVLGPDVYNPLTNIHQSPLFENRKIDQTYVYLRRRRLKQKLIKSKLLEYLPIVDFTLNNIIQRKKSSSRLKKTQIEDACLHGSFLIFSKIYLEKFPDGLYDGTFMYGEEDILLFFCQYYHMKIVYDPRIQIFHYEEQSSKNTYRKNKEHLSYKLSEMEKSLNMLEKLVQKKST